MHFYISKTEIPPSEPMKGNTTCAQIKQYRNGKNKQRTVVLELLLKLALLIYICLLLLQCNYNVDIHCYLSPFFPHPRWII